jgi:hypothetical protein
MIIIYSNKSTADADASISSASQAELLLLQVTPLQLVEAIAI